MTFPGRENYRRILRFPETSQVYSNKEMNVGQDCLIEQSVTLIKQSSYSLKQYSKINKNFISNVNSYFITF